MKTYDVECPICGTINKSLYLQETGGWMECSRCSGTIHAYQIKRNKPTALQRKQRKE